MDTGVHPMKFRNALSGYNKDDVNAYIKEIDIQHSEKLTELQELIAALQSEKDTLLGEKESLQKEIEISKENLQASAEKLSETDRLLAERNARVEEQDLSIKDLQKRLDVYRAQTEAQNTVIEKLRADKESTEKDSAVLKESLQQAKIKIETLTAELDTVRADAAARLQEMEASVAAAHARAEEEIARFQAAFTEDEDSAGYKCQMYDKISGQIGDILLGANRSADEILGSAREDADRLRTETAEEMQKDRDELQAELARLRKETEQETLYIRERLSETAEKLLSDISGELHINIDNCIKELATCMTEVEYDAETMLQSMQKRCREMNDRIQYYQSCVQDSIDQKLLDMDQKYGIPGTEKSV